MKVEDLEVGLRVKYKGNLSGHHERVRKGCLGTVIRVDSTDRPRVDWDGLKQWTYVGNFKKVK